MQFMIIDDSNTMRRIVGLALKSGGYPYIEAENGQDALDKLDKADDIDLFIVDIDMPVMNGIDFVKNLRQKQQYTSKPVLILTTQTDEKVRSAAKEVGADAWIVKPFEKEEFLNLIKTLINK